MSLRHPVRKDVRIEQSRRSSERMCDVRKDVGSHMFTVGDILFRESGVLSWY